jgi:hypothetical protein
MALVAVDLYGVFVCIGCCFAGFEVDPLQSWGPVVAGGVVEPLSWSALNGWKII